MAHQVALRFSRLSIFAHSIHRLSKLAGGSRGPHFCRSKPSILIGTQERPHRLHHARIPKLFFARRSAMPGDHAIIVTAAVSQQERLCRTQDNPRFGVGRLLLFSGIELALSSKPRETAGLPRRRLFLFLLVAPIDVALNPAAGLSHSAARPTGPWAGISLRARSSPQPLTRP
jgi:hypothetical protein